MKRCSTCKIKKDTSEFHNNRRSRDGKMNRCKVCNIAQSREVYRNSSSEELKIKRAAWLARKGMSYGEVIKQNKDRRLKEGFCLYCKQKRLANSNLFCLKHWFVVSARKNTGTCKNWEILKGIADKQNYRCVYTGVELIPGVNMELDHISPRSRFPELAFLQTNWQWVSGVANWAKGDQTHDEFVEMCKVVVETMGCLG